MPELSLTLCGRPSVREAGRDLALPAKSLALLAFLALEPGPHSREELTALLWGESPEDKAGASFRQALSTLRATVGDLLRIDRTAVELDPAVRSDVTTFLERSGSDPATAASADIPSFLLGLAIRGSPGFDEWRDVTRARLVAKYRAAVADAARGAAARQDWRSAAALAERWVKVDETGEDAARLLMEARYLAGDRGGALAAHAEFLARIDQGGATSAPGLRDLARRIEAGETNGTRPNGGHELRVGLVGRDREWNELLAAWEAVRKGTGTLVLIEGPPGTGKTRLTEDFGRWITTNGGSSLRGRAFAGSGAVTPGPIVEVLRGALKVPGAVGTDPASLAEVARIVPDVRKQFPATPATPSTGSTPVLAEAVAELLSAAAEDRHLLVVIEDLHWADAYTCSLLQYLVRRLESAPIVWCITLASGELGRDDPPARLARVLRASAAARLELEPLAPEQVWALIREAGKLSGATAGRRLAGRLHEVTGGNPFVLLELLKTLLAKGWLGTDSRTGEWLVQGAAGQEAELGTLSAAVADSIGERIARLTEDEHAILMSISVAGNGCTTNVLSHIHGISRLRAAAIGDGLVERALAVEAGGRYRATHPVVAGVVQARMTTARRREFHRAIALALVAAAGDEGHAADPADVARHAHEGGESQLAFQQALAAGRRSREQQDFEVALGWLDLAAASAVDPTAIEATDRERAELALAAGWVDPPARIRPSGSEAAISLLDFDLETR